jgi:hypothetical protein
MFIATFHCIAETRIHDRSYPSGGHRLVGPAWVSDLNRLRKNSEISSVSRLGYRSLGEHHRKPKPFLWTADPDRIIEKVNRGHQVIASDH